MQQLLAINMAQIMKWSYNKKSEKLLKNCQLQQAIKITIRTCYDLLKE